MYKATTAKSTPVPRVPSHNETITTVMVSTLLRAARWAKWLARVIYLVTVLSFFGVAFLLYSWLNNSQELLQHLTFWQSGGLLVLYVFFIGLLASFSGTLQKYTMAIEVLADSYSDFDLIEVQTHFDSALRKLSVILLMVLFLSLALLVIDFI